jgi:hypothetical protein
MAHHSRRTVPLQQLQFSTEYVDVPNHTDDALCVDDQYYDDTPFQIAEQPPQVRTDGDGRAEGSTGYFDVGPAANLVPDDGSSQSGDAVRQSDAPGSASEFLQDPSPGRARWVEQIAEKGADSLMAAAPICEGDESVRRVSGCLQPQPSADQRCTTQRFGSKDK